MLIDTHCHLYDEAFRDDFDAVLARAREAGLEACVMPGIDRAMLLSTRARIILASESDHGRFVEGLAIPHSAYSMSMSS